MNNQTALNEIFNTLSNIGIVDTKREFYEDWLNRSEGYVRYLKHAKKQPSTDALAVCKKHSTDDRVGKCIRKLLY